MNRQPCPTAGLLVLSIALAFPSAACAGPAEAAAVKAGVGLAYVGLAVASPAAFVAVAGVGTVLMVRSIAETVSRAPARPARIASYTTDEADSPFPPSGWYRPVPPQYELGTADASAFPVSTGMYGAVIVGGGK